MRTFAAVVHERRALTKLFWGGIVCTVIVNCYTCIQGGPKSRPLHLTVCIYKTICVIFGTLQHCFVPNTSVNSILNKSLTPVATPSDKINDLVFHLQNQARPLHSNAHVFKIPAPICTVFSIIEHRDILNMLITSVSSTAYYK